MNLVQHLLSRHYDPSRYQTTWFDDVEGVVTFPLYNMGKKLVGYQQYRPGSTDKATNNPRDGRYFTYRPRGDSSVFGLETVKREQRFVFVQEGVFHAAMLHMLGLPAVAVLGANNKGAVNELKMMGYTTLCLSDGDKAGAMLGHVCHYSHALDEGKDVNDYTLEEVYEMAVTLMREAGVMHV